MQGGNHEVRTAWGFLAVRLPMPEDKQWAEDRTTILQGLGVLDPEEKPTARFDVVRAAGEKHFGAGISLANLVRRADRPASCAFSYINGTAGAVSASRPRFPVPREIVQAGESYDSAN